MKKDAIDLLNLPMMDGETSTLESMQDVSGANLTVSQAVMMKQIQLAMKGNTEAAMFVQSVLGEEQDQEEGTGIAEAAKNGDTLAMLKAMRDKIAKQLDVAAPREASSLTRQLLEVNDRITKIEKDEQNKKGENPLNVIMFNSAKKRQRAARA